MKAKINETPFKLVGFTYNDFIRYCKKYHKRSYVRQSKVDFFKLVNEGKITKHGDKCFNDGEVF